MISNAKKAAVHVAAHQAGFTGDAYKDELEKATGVRSSLDLTDKTFSRAMDHFRAMGAKPVKSRYYRIIENLPEGDVPTMKKINAIRLDMNLSWKYVDGIAKRVAGVDAVQFAHGTKLRGVLQALIKHQNRKKGRG